MRSRSSGWRRICPRLEGGERIFGADPEQGAILRRPLGLLGREVEVPDARVRRAQGVAEPLLGLDGGVFGALARGHVAQTDRDAIAIAAAPGVDPSGRGRGSTPSKA